MEHELNNLKHLKLFLHRWQLGLTTAIPLDLDSYIKKYSSIPIDLFPTSAYIIFDFRTNKIAYFSPGSETWSGSTREEILQSNGIELMVSLFHPDDLCIVNEIQAESLRLYKEYPCDERIFLITRYNYRMISKQGETLYILVEYAYPEFDPESKNPLLGIVHMHDITGIKKDNTIYASITLVSKSGSRTLYSREFRKEVSELKISPREEEIIKSLAMGLSSKTIADLMGISVETVKTHRKNILKRLDAKSSAELIQIAYSHNLI